MITLALTIALATLLALYLYQRVQMAAARTRWRIAMEFISFGLCDRPQEFTAAFMAGNKAALDRAFPAFDSFYRDRMMDWEAAE